MRERTFVARMLGRQHERDGVASYPAFPTRAERVAYWRGRRFEVSIGEAFDHRLSKAHKEKA